MQHNSVRNFHWKVAIKLSHAFCDMDDWQRTKRVCQTYSVSRIVKGTYQWLHRNILHEYCFTYGVELRDKGVCFIKIWCLFTGTYQTLLEWCAPNPTRIQSDCRAPSAAKREYQWPWQLLRASLRKREKLNGSSFPLDFPSLALVACREAWLKLKIKYWLATQTIKQDNAIVIVTENKFCAQIEVPLIERSVCVSFYFQVPLEVGRRRISSSEPEKMNFVGRKMTTLSIK